MPCSLTIKMPTDDPTTKVFLNISNTFLSVARHSGGAKIGGVEYFYIPTEDALIWKGLIKAYNKHRKAGGNFAGFLETLKT